MTDRFPTFSAFMYLFDESLAWAAALTHEEIDGRRFCLWSGRR